METIKEYLRKIFDEKNDIHQRFFSIVLIVGIAGILLELILSFIFNYDLKSTLIIIFSLVLFAVAFFLTNNFKKLTLAEYLVLIIINNLTLPSLFVLLGGFKTGMPFLMLLGLIVTLFILQGKQRLIVFLINCVGCFGIIIYSIIKPEVLEPVNYPQFSIIRIILGMVFVVLILGIIFSYQALIYEKQFNKIMETMEESQKATKAKSEFLSNMSHDIRTPLYAVVGYTEIAKRNCEDRKKLMECFGKIKLSSNHLLNLINDVLDMSKIESGKIKIEEDSYNLKTIIKEINDMMKQTLADKNIKLLIDSDSLVDDVVSCDRLRLNQVLINLVSNAIKYSGDGSNVYLNVSQLPCDIEDKVLVRFVIKDEGVGMSKEFLKKLFQPFERENNSTISGVAGTGLGLAITKSIIEMMNGTINVESELGKGTEITVDIPFDIPTLTEIKDEEVDYEPEPEQFNFANKRLLLVEDNLFNREIATELLSDAGILVEEAVDGSVAVNMIKKSKPGYYSAVIMDVQMPVMNGYEATQMIRNLPDPQLSKIPVIAMTANAFDEDKQKAFQYGMNAYLSKPINIDDLMKVLKFILNEDSHKK